MAEPMMDRKAGYSSMCHRSDHVQCQAAQASCSCICHGFRVKPPKPAAKPLAMRVAKVRAPRQPRAPRVLPPRPAPAPVLVRPAIRKEDALCCVAKRDNLWRLPIGFCSAGCVRRPRLIEASEVAR